MNHLNSSDMPNLTKLSVDLLAVLDDKNRQHTGHFPALLIFRLTWICAYGKNACNSTVVFSSDEAIKNSMTYWLQLFVWKFHWCINFTFTIAENSIEIGKANIYDGCQISAWIVYFVYALLSISLTLTSKCVLAQTRAVITFRLGF